MSIFTDLAKTPEVEAEPVVENDFETLRQKYFVALRDKSVAMQNDPNFDLDEADIRFSTAMRMNQVRNALVVIIGAGGLGNWQWRILLSMGFRRIAIYDDDNVDIENVGSQAHSIFDIGTPKVEAVANAALEYRAAGIIPRNKRVMTCSDICEDLGEVPDIVIGCTDSAAFRNRFIEALKGSLLTCTAHPCNIPHLFIDYRMSLGDWVAYITPARAMQRLGFDYKKLYFEWYEKNAVFPESEAVQEPCTARAISYTGANVASFTGALLHQYYSGGKQQFEDNEWLKKFLYGETDMPARKISFSSKDFEFITETKQEKQYRKKLKDVRDQLNFAWYLLARTVGLMTCWESIGNFIEVPENYRDHFSGKIIILPTKGKAIICGYGINLEAKRDNDLTKDLQEFKPLFHNQPCVVYDVDMTTKRQWPFAWIFSYPEDTSFRVDNIVFFKARKNKVVVKEKKSDAWEVSEKSWPEFVRFMNGIPRLEDRLARAEEADFEIEAPASEEGKEPATLQDLVPGTILRVKWDEDSEELITIEWCRGGRICYKNSDDEIINCRWESMPICYVEGGNV